jgi:Holliday junction resolvase RusA-like endonuclease
MNKKNEEVLEYISPISTSNNAHNDYKVVRKGKKTFVQVYPSEEYTRYKEIFIPYLKKIVKKYEWEMIKEFKHYYLDLIIYFDRTNCDPTNYFKTLQDVATGILWFDDKIILGRVNRVYYTYNDDCRPHIECRLYPCEYADIGIFNDEKEYESFIQNCKNCKSYKAGVCKTLSEYMLYKITKDFDLKTRSCLKFKEEIAKTPKKKVNDKKRAT